MARIKRTSGNYVVETTVEKDNHDMPVFALENYFLSHSGEKEKYEALTISKRSYSAGLQLEMRKVGKRTQTQMGEIGLAELDLLIGYLTTMRDKVKNYAGEIEVLEP
jgi:hypothetical protein